MRTKVYTDGACSENPGPGGWAVVLCLPTDVAVHKGHDPETTNNRMELTAVIRALAEIRHIGEGSFEVCSDSAYVINAVNGGWVYKWRMAHWLTARGHDVRNRDLWEALLRQLAALKAEGVDVQFTKVRGHAGNALNELVDRIAKSESVVAKAERKKAQ